MISFLVTTKNEGQSVNDLLTQIVSIMGTGDEIVLVDDYSTDLDTIEILERYESLYSNVTVHYNNLENDFASHKNYGIEQCTKDWVFQIDADEIMHEYLATNVHTLLEYNNDVDLFLIPRVNVVNGLTSDDIIKWNWRLNEKNWVMWPDYQTRLFKRSPNIRWVGKVHERIEGHTQFSALPEEEQWSLYHIKDIEKQRAQNALYETI